MYCKLIRKVYKCGDLFPNFSQQLWIGKIIFLALYAGVLVILSALVLFPLFKVFKLKT